MDDFQVFRQNLAQHAISDPTHTRAGLDCCVWTWLQAGVGAAVEGRYLLC